MSRLRDYLRLVETTSEDFVLAPGLPAANYRIGPLSTVGEWQAKIILANSAMADQKPGDWDAVGYVMISLVSNEIIPIARADEHSTGYDLLWHFAKPRAKKTKPLALIPEQFVPVNKGQNFVYSEDGAEHLATVGRKWLAWGGPDVVVRGAYEMDGLFGRLSDLVRDGLKMRPETGRLNVMGERFMKALHALSPLIGRYEMAERAGGAPEALKRSIFSRAKVVVRDALPVMEHLWVETPSPDEMEPRLAALAETGDVAGLQDLLYGFHGVKNSIHQKVREALANPRAMRAGETRAVFGDLDLANGLLAEH